MHRMREADAAAQALRTRGFAHLRAVLSPERARAHHRRVSALVEALRARHDPAAPLHCAEGAVQALEPGATRTPTGLALSQTPNDGDRELLLPSPLVALARTLFDTPVLEITGCVVSDERRPDFPWHTHIDGVDEGERQRSGDFPVKRAIERVFALLYLDDQTNDDAGVLRVLPRGLGEPTRNPHPLHEWDWPGAIEPRPHAGDLIVLDECTYHAVRARRGPGLRIFAGTYLASAACAPAPWAVPELRDLLARGHSPTARR